MLALAPSPVCASVVVDGAPRVSLNLAVYVVEVWHEGRWTCTPASGHLYVYSRRKQAEAMRRYLRGQKIKARVTPAVLS